MCKKSIPSLSLALLFAVLLPGVGRAADPNLMGRWKFDGDGLDSSGNGRNGTLMGGATFGTGHSGQALALDGADDYFTVNGYKGILSGGAFSVTAWINSTTTTDATIAYWGRQAAGARVDFRLFEGRLRVEHGNGNRQGNTVVADGQWHHVTLTAIADATLSYPDVIFYVDGQDDSQAGTDPDKFLLAPHSANVDVAIGSRIANNSRFFPGLIDEVRIYDRVLTPLQVKSLAELGYIGPATDPMPADGSMYMDTWVTLSWRPGDVAASHNLYFGTAFDDVNAGAETVFVGNTTQNTQPVGFPGFPAPEGLVPGSTYYWRVDEVNNTHADSPWRGAVWSFWMPFKTGYDPEPVDGAQFEDPNVDLSWKPGMNAIMHAVYFGTDADQIANATGASVQMATTFDPGPLNVRTTYYWRADTFNGAAWVKGPVWSFRTMPTISMTDDPTLVAWWKLDEGPGTTVVDWSGYNHHGKFAAGDAQWVEGIDGGALEFPVRAVQMTDYEGVLGTQNRTVTAWIKTAGYGDYISWGQNVNTQKWICRVQNTVDGVIGALRTECSGGFIIGSTVLTDDEWHHVTSVLDVVGTASIDDIKLYVDGWLETVSGWQAIDVNTVGGRTVWLGDGHQGRLFPGRLDDVRIYDRALTQDQIKLVLRGDMLLAWQPEPRNGQTVDMDNALPLRWQAGNKASQHDVYFGTDKGAVESADTSTAGVYRSRQSGTNYTPAEGIQWGGGPYYWRIDEYNNDGTTSKGRVWSFTVADFRPIDDFESYGAGTNQIWYAWHDGLGYGMPGTPPYFAGNGTGSAVGDENTASFTEETIVHGDRKSMPLAYDNNKQGFAKYSEVELTLTASRDWSKYGVGELSLWFRGYPGSVGSFVEAPAGIFTMTASGVDIWGTADQFHFAYKTLTGAGSIVAKVESVQNTNAWAKAGVMIRETLDAGSKHAFTCVTPANGVAFQGRTDTDTASFSTNQTGLAAPYWVKLERDAAGNFTASASANGTTWQSISTAIPQGIPMSSVVYVGLALTSHDAALTCQAKFSGVTMTGAVSGQWTHQDIGIASNAAEPLYIAVSNTAGQPAVVVHPDPAAATLSTWTEWVIPLQKFTDQGVNLANVDKLAIGLGTRGNMTTPGGSGKMYFDDIHLYQPRNVP